MAPLLDPFTVACRFVGHVEEIPGQKHHPFVQWAHSLCGLGTDQPDETPWCSSFVNAVHFIAGLYMTRSAAARSWLQHGSWVNDASQAQQGDVVVLSRGDNPTLGHVGFYVRSDAKTITLLGGNQDNQVSIAVFSIDRVVGVRRYWW